MQILAKKASLDSANLTTKKRVKPPKTAPNLSPTTMKRRWRAAARLAATTALLDAGARRVLSAHFFRKLNRSAKSYFLRFFRKLRSQKYFATQLSLKFPFVFASQAYKGLDAHKISLSVLDTAGEQAHEI